MMSEKVNSSFQHLRKVAIRVKFPPTQQQFYRKCDGDLQTRFSSSWSGQAIGKNQDLKGSERTSRGWLGPGSELLLLWATAFAISAMRLTYGVGCGFFSSSPLSASCCITPVTGDSESPISANDSDKRNLRKYS